MRPTFGLGEDGQMRRQLRRSGVTLIEVLIAILILSVGVISVMAFFPIGALNMVQSFKDERCAQGAHNADAMIRVQWKDWYVNQYGGLRTDFDLAATAVGGPYTVGGPAPFDVASQMETDKQAANRSVLRYLDHWSWPAGNVTDGNVILPSDFGPSWPVLIDPVGMNTRLPATPIAPLGLSHNYVGDVPGLLTRVELPIPGFNALAPLFPQRVRIAALPDDMSFKVNGAPTDVENGGELDRGYRYTYAWLIQRPANNDVNNNRTKANLFILAFDGRPYADLPSQELVFSLNGAGPTGAPVNGGTIVGADQNSIVLQYTTEKPPIKKGGYVMLAFMNSSNPATPPRPVIDFYRTSSIEDEGTNQVRLNFERPIVPFAGPLGYVVIFEKLGEVFRRETLNTTYGPSW
jgi:prepilin-type N-terminal cleavage/methylation domain-containing protein